MNKKFLKIALALISALAASLAGTVSAQAAEIKPLAISNCAATLRIVSVPGSSLSSVVFSGAPGGHSFLIINNDRTTSITVAGLAVPVDGQVTVGTWGNKNNGKGIYLNYEAYFGSSSYSNRVSLEACITTSQLTTLNSLIISNNSWSDLNNCSSFASKVWNGVVTDRKVSAGTVNTPNGLISSIKSKSPFYTNTSFMSVSSSSVYRLQTNNALVKATI